MGNDRQEINVQTDQEQSRVEVKVVSQRSFHSLAGIETTFIYFHGDVFWSLGS
jgi:hypothetical protein